MLFKSFQNEEKFKGKVKLVSFKKAILGGKKK
jgi:hypothetical protein